MTDKLEDWLQAEAMHRVFHQKDWQHIVDLELKLKEKWVKEALANRPKWSAETPMEAVGDPLGKYTAEQLVYKGRREALELLWKERESLMAKLKQKEENNE